MATKTSKRPDKIVRMKIKRAGMAWFCPTVRSYLIGEESLGHRAITSESALFLSVMKKEAIAVFLPTMSFVEHTTYWQFNLQKAASLAQSS